MSDGKMVTCANCGNVRPEGTRFCGSCGTPFPQVDQAASPAEPPPTTSSTKRRRRVWVAVGAAAAVLVAGGAVAALSMTDRGGSTQATPTESVTEPITDTTESDVLGDTTDTTDASAETDQGAEQTCEDLVAVDNFGEVIGTGSVADVERFAAAISELASRAPAEPAGTLLEGEPRESLAAIGLALESYAALLTELGVEPSSDTSSDSRLVDAIDEVGSLSADVDEWIAERCSPEQRDQILND